MRLSPYGHDVADHRLDWLSSATVAYARSRLIEIAADGALADAQCAAIARRLISWERSERTIAGRSANPLRASRPAGRGRRPSRPRCRGVCCGGR